MLQKLFKSLKFENIKKLNLLFNIFKKMFVTLLKKIFKYFEEIDINT